MGTLSLGRCPENAEFPAAGTWDGEIAEAKVRLEKMLIGWCLAEYMDQSDPQMLMGIGAVDSASDSGVSAVAVPDFAETGVNTQVIIPVMVNDFNPGNGGLKVQNLSAPTSGSVALLPNNTVQYTPATNFVGDAHFTYELTDASLKVSVGKVRVSVKTVAANLGYDYEFKLPWKLPTANANIVFIDVPATGAFTIPQGTTADWNRVLVLVAAPDASATNLRISGDRIRWGGLILIGFEFDWVGYLTRFSEDNQGPFWGGNVWQVSHSAGASGFMPAPLRPYVFMANTRFSASTTKWGDWWRGGTDSGSNAAPLDNPNDWNDFLVQKFKLSGHHNWDPPEDGTSGHSDVAQFPQGGSNDIIFCDCDLEQNGLGIYPLDSGAITNNIKRTKAPVGSRFVVHRISHKNLTFQSENPRIDDGTYRCVNQSRDAKVWTMTDGRWRQMNIQDYKTALTPNQQNLGNNFQDRFNTPNYPQPVKVVENGRTFARWNPAIWQGKPTVVGDLQAELVALNNLPERVPLSQTGRTMRITTHDQLRAIFPDTP